MSEHTKGPWEARWSERGQYWFIDHEQGGEGYTLTKLNCEEADARLISAAPDLLAALHDLLAATEETYDSRHEREAALDAIAKATWQEV
jgi:hypothetical protein